MPLKKVIRAVDLYQGKGIFYFVLHHKFAYIQYLNLFFLGKIKDIDVEDYWHVINYNYSQIQFAEIKASAVISIYSILIGLGFTLDILDDENDYNLGFDSFYWIIKVILFIAAFYFTIVSLKRCIQCILPILNLIIIYFLMIRIFIVPFLFTHCWYCIIHYKITGIVNIIDNDLLPQYLHMLHRNWITR